MFQFRYIGLLVLSVAVLVGQVGCSRRKPVVSGTSANSMESRKAQPDQVDPSRKGTAESFTKPATEVVAKKSAQEVQQILQGGGKHWKVVGFARGLFNSKIEPGDRIWIWPAQDQVGVAKAGGFSIPMNWYLRPDKELPKSTVEAYLTFASTTKDHIVRAHVKELDPNTNQGRGVVVPYAPQKGHQGEADVDVYFSDYEGTPISNIVQMKVSFVD